MSSLSTRVTLVIVNWNSGELLERCLAALDVQTRPPDEIIVVDNASRDRSAEAAASRPNVRLIPLPENVGFAAANNLAVREAGTSDWIATLNPDALPEPDWLARLVEAAQARPGYASFGSRLVLAEAADRLDGTGDIYHVSGLAWRRDHGTPIAEGTLSAGEIFAPCAAAALYRRDAFLAAGGFDERYFCYVEDVDLGFRLRLLGHGSWYVPDASVRHVGSALTGRHSAFYVYHGHRNLVWTYVKNMPATLLWRYLPQHVLLNAASVVWFSLRGHARTILRAKLHAVRDLPLVWRQRRAIQQTRRVDARELRRTMARGWLRPYFRSGAPLRRRIS